MASESEKKKYHAKNWARLKALGMSDADINSYQGIWGNHINDDEYDRIVPKWKAQVAKMDARAPEFLRNDPSFKALSPDMKEIAIYNYEIQQANDKQIGRASCRERV